jgi:hypothetical protein
MLVQADGRTFPEWQCSNHSSVSRRTGIFREGGADRSLKVLSSHSFKNDKTISVGYLNRTDQRKFGVPECDTLALTFITGEYERSYCIRPDEALIIIQLLAEAVVKSVKGYEVGLKRTI